MYNRLTKDVIEEVAPNCKSFSQLAAALGRAPIGSNISTIRKKCLKWCIDTSHFLSKRHRLGKQPTSYRKAEEILVIRDPSRGRENSSRLRRALVDSGVEYVCSCCGHPPMWNGKELTLHVDHINGLYWENVIDNLRFLCPNCHTQTENFGSRNKISHVVAPLLMQG